MQVKAIIPRGYCKGVVRAINIAKKSIEQYPKPIYILGMIVHNKYIVSSLKELGVITIDKPNASREELLDLIDSGTVIITAHGCSDNVITKAKNKGLEVIDATCLDVITTHNLIKEYLSNDYDILYIGKKGHPESEGAIGIDKNRIHLITSKDDLKTLNQDKKYVLTNQTTMSIYDIYDICESAKNSNLDITIIQEVCNATKIRQEAISNIDEEVDIVFIVGDPHSNNTKKLANIASTKANKEVYMIESVKDIDINVLKGKKCAAVSSGASTPTYLTNQVIQFLEQFDSNDKDTHIIPEIDLNKIL